MAIEDDIMDSMAKPSIDWSNPDYTGASASKYVDKYTNRPEDAGSIEGVHNTLEGMGYINPLADIANSSIYLLEGNYGMAGLSLMAALPVVGELAGVNKIINKSLLKGPSAYAKKNKELVKLGDNSRYINTEIINIPSTQTGKVISNNYQISHTDDYMELIADIAGKRPAVVVKIKNLDSGNTVFQPFYRSSGTGHSSKSAGNWLPFEGVLSEGTDVVINYGKNNSKKIWSPLKEGNWRKDITIKKPDGGLGFKPGMTKEGWLVKGFKNKDGAIITSSLFENKVKRGLPVHEKIDFYLRNKLNFDVIPKTGKKETLTPLQEKLNALRDNPNFARNMGNAIKENIKRYNK